MKGYSDTGHLSRKQANFNYRLSQARNVVENALGRLKGPLEVLAEELHNVCVVHLNCTLHNICEVHRKDITTSGMMLYVQLHCPSPQANHFLAQQLTARLS